MQKCLYIEKKVEKCFCRFWYQIQVSIDRLSQTHKKSGLSCGPEQCIIMYFDPPNPNSESESSDSHVSSFSKLSWNILIEGISLCSGVCEYSSAFGRKRSEVPHYVTFSPGLDNLSYRWDSRNITFNVMGNLPRHSIVILKSYISSSWIFLNYVLIAEK